MTFKTDFLVEDYKTLCWFQVKRVTTVLALLIAAALGFTAFAAIRNIPIAAVILIALYPAFFALARLFVYKRAERRFAAFGVSSELNLSLDDEKIVQRAGSGETELLWSDVYRIAKSDDCYYVFLTKRKAFYFPKRSFEDDKAREKFIDLIQKNVDKKKINI